MGGILVLGRHPDDNKGKTRLKSTLGEESTRKLYRAFLEDTLRACRETGAHVVLAHTGGPAFKEEDIADSVFVQQGEGLGERLDSALLKAREIVSGPLLVIGSDTPHLSPRTLQRAFEALKNADAVIGPSSEGGFYLLGFANRLIAIGKVFAADNETAELARVLTDTGMKPTILEYFFDIDVESDLVDAMLYLETLTSAQADWVPAATRRVIKELGLKIEPKGAITETRGRRISK